MKITIDTEKKTLKIDTCKLNYREAEKKLTELFNGDSWKDYTMTTPIELGTTLNAWNNGLIGHINSGSGNGHNIQYLTDPNGFATLDNNSHFTAP